MASKPRPQPRRGPTAWTSSCASTRPCGGIGWTNAGPRCCGTVEINGPKVTAMSLRPSLSFAYKGSSGNPGTCSNRRHFSPKGWPARSTPGSKARIYEPSSASASRSSYASPFQRKTSSPSTSEVDTRSCHEKPVFDAGNSESVVAHLFGYIGARIRLACEAGGCVIDRANEVSSAYLPPTPKAGRYLLRRVPGRPLGKVPPDVGLSRLAASGPEAVAAVDGPVLRRFERNRRRGATFRANHLMGLPGGARSA